MRVVHGDLLKLALAGDFDVIVHGCNCFGTMGKGIAVGVHELFPEAYEADLATPRGDRAKLGTISVVNVDRDLRRITIVNGYTQFDYRGDGVRADYDAIRSVFRELKRRYSGKRIGYPKIGAGLARGDWSIIAPIIDEELAGEDHTLVEYAP